jgi:hypothetical protein
MQEDFNNNNLVKNNMIEDSIVNQEQKVYRKILNSKEKTEQYMEEMYTEVNKYYGEGVKEKGKTGVNWI